MHHGLVGFLVLSGSLLAACASGRPDGPSCGDMRLDPDRMRVSAVADSVSDAGGRPDPLARAVAAEIMEGLPEPDAARKRDAYPALDVITLSAGGQYGAFGAGFVTGWSANEVNRRPDSFNLVTGVSAGALIAPFVGAGRTHDPGLRAVWRGIDDETVLRRRSLLTLPWWRSIYDLSPAEKRIRQNAADLIAGLRDARRDGRKVMVGAVNLDNGKFEVFHLTAADIVGESEEIEDPVGCIAQAALASAAIPVGFPARVIDGHLYVDGGTRKHVFFEAIDLVADAMVPGEGAAKVNAYIIVNSDLRVPAARPDANPLDGGLRAATIVIDETLRQSVVEVIGYAKSKGWSVYGVTAAGLDIGGPDPSKQFDGAFTARLFDAGASLAADPGFHWLTAEELEAQVFRRQVYEN